MDSGNREIRLKKFPSGKVSEGRGGSVVRRGFTLAELLAVMTIIFILAAVVVPKYTKLIHDSQVKTNEANAALIKAAAEIYWSNESGTDYQKSLNLGGSTGAEVTGIHVLIAGGYLKDGLNDPRNHEPYILKVTSYSPFRIEVKPRNNDGY